MCFSSSLLCICQYHSWERPCSPCNLQGGGMSHRVTSPSRSSTAAGPSAAEYQALVRENARLTSQVRRLQDVVSTMREEIADANAEVAALTRLHEEQHSLVLQELARERGLRQKLQAHITERANVQHASVGTGTVNETGTSTQSDATTSTVSSGVGRMTITDDVDTLRLGGGGEYLIEDYPAATAGRNAPTFGRGLSVAPPKSTGGFGGGPQPLTMRGAVPVPRSAPAAAAAPASNTLEVHQFGDWLTRMSGYRPSHPSRDLGELFDTVLGATSAGEVCATVTERDLVEFGVPVAKARAILHYVMEHAAFLLAHS